MVKAAGRYHFVCLVLLPDSLTDVDADVSSSPRAWRNYGLTYTSCSESSTPAPMLAFDIAFWVLPWVANPCEHR